MCNNLLHPYLSSKGQNGETVFALRLSVPVFSLPVFQFRRCRCSVPVLHERVISLFFLYVALGYKSLVVPLLWPYSRLEGDPVSLASTAS
jgi:hypothetical protein